MSIANICVTLNLVLNAGATIAYAAQGRWNLALYWLGAAVIGGAMLWSGLR